MVKNFTIQQFKDFFSQIWNSTIFCSEWKLKIIWFGISYCKSVWKFFFFQLTDFGLSYTRGGSGSDYMMNQVVGTPIYMGKK